MNSVPVRKHKRSPRGSRKKVLAQVRQYCFCDEQAQKVVTIATALYAIRACEWAKSTFAHFCRKMRGSKFDPMAWDNITFYFLLTIWQQVIDESKHQTSFDDQEWCNRQNQSLAIYGLRLPANSRDANVKILKAARMVLSSQL